MSDTIKKNIVVLDAKAVTKGDMQLDILKKYGELTLYDNTSKEEVPERIKDAHIILCSKTILDRDNLKDANQLEYIGLFATGYNNIDIDYTNECGIIVCNAGSYSTEAVAQHTFALMLEHFNQVGKYHEFVKNDGWKHSDVFAPIVYSMGELMGKTIGLIGCGSIGRKVATIANAFDMKVLAYARHPVDIQGVTFTDLDTLLECSDVISVHCPLNEQSQHMFSYEAFAKCKDGAFFINTSRGPIVDENALLEALQSGKLSGAALDVIEIEPMHKECVLQNAPNLIITPHVAWAPIETRKRLFNIVMDNIEKFLEGTPVNVVT